MGCDLHLYCEIQRDDGTWEHAQGVKKDDDSQVPDVPYPDRIYSGRNYELFGWLAGVRCPENQEFEEKGFPDDASPEVARIFASWGNDAHTPSWIYVDDILKHAKGTVIVEGKMDKKQKEELDADIVSKKPKWDKLYPHCGDTTDKSFVKFKYDVPRSFMFGSFFEAMEKCNQYKFGHGKARIVFWFDN